MKPTCDRLTARAATPMTRPMGPIAPKKYCAQASIWVLKPVSVRSKVWLLSSVCVISAARSPKSMPPIR